MLLTTEKIWCHYHNSASHLSDECYHQRNSKFENGSFVDGKNRGNQKIFIADSNPTGCDAKFFCNCKRENNSDESNDGSYSLPPGIRFTFVACHLPLSQQGDGFQLLVDSGSSEHFVDPELICRLEWRMLEYTKNFPCR